MKKCFILLLLAAPLFVFAQTDYVIPVVHDITLQTPFVNSQGDVVFNLPAGHVPITVPNTLEYEQAEKTYHLNAFPSGICPVKTPEGEFYWIDKTGKEIKNFGNSYAKMTPFSEGHCLVSEEIEEDVSYWLIFLDESGDNAFGDKKFWEAKPFSEGVAGVQLDDRNGEWGYIDKSGEIVIRIDDRIAGKVSELGSFHEGLAKVESYDSENNRIHNYYINKSGKIVVDVERVMANKRIVTISDFADGIAFITIQDKNGNDDEYKLALIDKTGKVLGSFEDVTGFIPFEHGLANLTINKVDETDLDKNVLMLLDHNLKEVKPINNTPTVLVSMERISDTYYVGSGTNPIEHEFETLIFSRSSNELVYKTFGKVVGMIDDLILVKYNRSAGLELKKISGQSLWKSDESLWLFNDITDALRVKDKVRHYEHAKQDKIPAHVFKLNNLERLILRYSGISSIPKEISQLKNLKELELSNLSNVKSLPIQLVQLTKLQRLVIEDCSNLKNIEALIYKMPSLRTLELFNYDFSNDFIENVRKVNPQLSISFSSSQISIVE